MTTWNTEDLAAIDRPDEVEITSLRPDGSARPYRIIWGVRVDDEFYVRSVNGPDAAWFRGTRTRHDGRVRAGGTEYEVSFVDTDDGEMNDRIDTAYRAKYRRYPNPVRSITSPAARSATLKLVPRTR
ncbi:DUF2255 family protein [Amycolatopsis saalfeldensis]|uniref:DUF2255 family protein n=1 Tax=Amycolatopsis saalfeldensis TaxID=394193 RepID=A0A1H8Y8Z0_9PSEU|nr:DUF2255 family protein [Amycolatopsis saalfeldensis]SEP48461.1 hypothetical protein SAMN04489732_11245 [Amycolatopsis saalfeldensis]